MKNSLCQRSLVLKVAPKHLQTMESDIVNYHELPALQANRWQQLSPGGTAPTARNQHTAVWSPAADGMYVFGGHGGSRVLSAVVALHGLTELNPMVRWKPFW